MVNLKEALIVVGIFGAGVMYAINSVSEATDREEDTAKRIEVLERAMQIRPVHPTQQALRQAAYEARLPCGGALTWLAPKDLPVEYPTPEWCIAEIERYKLDVIKTKAQADLETEEKARQMPWDQMFDCVYSYDLGLSPIDTVAKPMVHDSWVLGGECEKLAHDLRDNEYPGEVWNEELANNLALKGMCVGFTDDSPIEAAKCQKNMQRWLEVLCWNTLEDNEIRACKRAQLMTTLDHDEDERPW